ncbi:hypothetical protein A4A49_42705 [Nicotiana attenuata]|uniref:Uncharacterized protein n=1 Tax=Nicotiana attenuata TaxID=49451 RepID=A0A1J6JMM4_NICAT|nr:hypothetical protein A4A49_57442 [Nicotiana attenuata]OIT19029.1 hypothetical protein A4A49_42705 [Nicotiana attenuata]
MTHHLEPGSPSQSDCKGPKQGFGDVWCSTMAGDDDAKQSKTHATNQRPTLSPQHDATDIQHHAFLPGPNSVGPLCNTPVQTPSPGTTTRNFVINAGETTLSTSGEYLERDIKGLGNTEEPRSPNGKGNSTNRQPSESRLSLAGSSSSCRIQCGPQRDTDTPMPQEPSQMRNGPILSSKSRYPQTPSYTNHSDEISTISTQGKRSDASPGQG